MAAGLLAALLATACSGGAKGSPQASPTAQLPKTGIVERPLCLSLRTSIQTDLRTEAEDRAAGDEAAAAQVQSKVDTAVASARRIKDCNVDDLLAARTP